MNAPDLFALHEAIKHYAYTQAQLHPLNADAWLQMPYYAEVFVVLCAGGFIGWWLRGLMRSSSGTHIHEHSGRRFERHATGKWLQHLHDPETGELDTLKVCAEEPPGVTPPRVELGSGQRLKRAR